ncbi:MAG: hypothetical protein A2Y62_06685 [Candidatus Fischerbacteria bacterium RBG_13_37_8]|uniref:SnoaL-like domain-containing protein n=1 Tax=Candidatus Fischerbacteria bacterium RBG_13_37_8 TaxID=1817863 RepID=A0A1F5VM59_9BACT|nr:MAG: hypothetical protein A2Y62_06685 [Candidatus Fischerbacteria bacterium RBG_13_37_8]
MSKEKIAGLLVLAIVIAVLCYYLIGGESTKDVIYQAKEDFENENLDRCFDYLSPKYFKDHKYTPDQLKARAKELFDLVDNIEVQIISLDIKEEGTTGWAKIGMKIFANYGNQKVIILGQPLKAFQGELFFEKEKNKWKIVRSEAFPI